MKKELIEQLIEAKEVIDRAQSIQDAIGQIETEELSKQDEKIKSIEDKKESIASFKFLYLFEIIGVIVGTVIFPVIGTVIGYVVGALVHHGLSAGLMAIHFPGSDKRIQKAEAYYKEEMPKALAEKETIVNKIEQLNTELLAIQKPDILDGEYCESHIVEYLISVLKSGRADSLKEALNLYEDKKHNDHMLKLQQEQVKIANDHLNTSQKTAELQEKSLEQQQKILKQQQKQSKQLKYGNTLHTINTIHHWDKK